jgi:hypothetical protein
MIPHTTVKTPLDTTDILNAIATVMVIVPITAPLIKRHEITRPHHQIQPSIYPNVSMSMVGLSLNREWIT